MYNPPPLVRLWIPSSGCGIYTIHNYIYIYIYIHMYNPPLSAPMDTLQWVWQPGPRYYTIAKHTIVTTIGYYRRLQHTTCYTIATLL